MIYPSDCLLWRMERIVAVIRRVAGYSGECTMQSASALTPFMDIDDCS